MKYLFYAFLCLLPLSLQAVADRELAAREAADRWLVLIDGGQYNAALDAAAPSFRKSIKREEWNDGLKQVRAPMGAVKKRTLKRLFATYLLPDAPEGDYMVVTYRTTFADRVEPRDEIIILANEKDAGSEAEWLVLSYFIE